jgi:hypothetical protein
MKHVRRQRVGVGGEATVVVATGAAVVELALVAAEVAIADIRDSARQRAVAERIQRFREVPLA